MNKIDGMYEIGQYVYTNCDIRGWFDYSMNGILPANKIGTIISYAWVGKNLKSVVYEIDFGQEFGHVLIKHFNLKLG